MDWAAVQRVLGPWQKPVVMSRYPHMMYQDRVIWSRFLTYRGEELEGVWYDVLVGTPIATGPEATDAERRLARGTGCKRIDVVMAWRRGISVVEVKPFGNHAALGQAVLYRDLFVHDFPTVRPVLGMIVCGEADVDLDRVARTVGVDIAAVGTPWEEA